MVKEKRPTAIQRARLTACSASVTSKVTLIPPRSATAITRTDAELVPIDEKRFLFLVQQTPFFALQVMRVMAERLRQAIEAMRVEHEGRPLTTTVSLGVADALPGEDPDARDADRLVARADEALYRAKAAGRNRVEVG